MRLFLALKLPPFLLTELAEYQTLIKWNYLRLTPVSNLHFTLVFLGEIKEENITQIDKCILKIQQKFINQTINIKLKNIEYGPNLRFPRFVWLKGEPNESLKLLHYLIRNSLNNIINLNTSVTFLPHITLARFKSDSKPLFLKPLPKANLFNNRIIQTDSFWLMESKLSFHENPKYYDVKQYSLKK